MLGKLFLHILNMSFTASFVIVFVLIARLLLKRAPKVFSYVLWSVVLFRLICPFSFESILSPLPAKTTPISQDIVYMQVSKIDTGITAINHTVNAVLPKAKPVASVNPIQIWLFAGELLWLLGILILLLHGLITLWRLKKQLQNASLYQEHIYISQKINTAFVMGVFRPKIYLPANLGATEREYILCHEKTHLKRLDHIFKLISFFVLCIHWFNPLVWIAFFVSGKDMEMSCDEAVIRQLGNAVKKDYSASLLTLATGKKIVGGTPLAFGEGDTKGRVKNVLHYKKPAFWGGIAILAAVILIMVSLMSNPVNDTPFLKVDTLYDLNHIDNALYGYLIFDEKVEALPIEQMPEITTLLKELRVASEPISENRDEERDATHQIQLVLQGHLDSTTPYDLYFNFNSRFDEVWLNDGIKPTLSYAVINPADVKSFFEQHFDNASQSIVIDAAEALWSARTKYVGNNSAVGELISLLPVISDLQYDHFELQTTSQPYKIEIVYSVPKASLTKYNTKNTSFRNYVEQNALLLLALIENVDEIQVTLTDGNQEVSFINGREWADYTVDADVRDYAESPEKLMALMTFITENETDEIIIANYSIMKLGADGEILSRYSIEDSQLAKDILMDALVQSSMSEGVDINTLATCYLIRQYFPEVDETHDYYAYFLKDGRSVLQNGTDGYYTVFNSSLYAKLIALFDATENTSS